MRASPREAPRPGSTPIAPLPFDPAKLKGLSEKLLRSHHENNYGGAVKNLNKVEEELARVTKDTPGFVVGGLKERELTFNNSMVLHELYFGNLGGDGKAGSAVQAAIGRRLRQLRPLGGALPRRGDVPRWRQRMGGARPELPDGAAGHALERQPHPDRRVQRAAAGHGHVRARLRDRLRCRRRRSTSTPSSRTSSGTRSSAGSSGRRRRPPPCTDRMGGVPAEAVRDEETSLREVFWYFLKLGWLAFGGPVGQIGLMHLEVVERRRWLDEEEFIRALNFCHVLPGPEALQLAIYIGWQEARLPGRGARRRSLHPARLPDAHRARLDLRALRKEGRGARRALGVPPGGAGAAPRRPGADLARRSEGTVSRRAGDRSPSSPSTSCTCRSSSCCSAAESCSSPGAPSVGRSVAASGAALVLLASSSARAASAATERLLDISWFFLKVGLFSFGGAYAVLPYIREGAVATYGWLTDPQMIDALALGETTPGPLISIGIFVGYLAGHAAGRRAARRCRGHVLALPAVVRLRARRRASHGAGSPRARG